MAQEESQLREEANNPNTSQERLFELASTHPELFAEIAANPSSYDDLLQWLGQQGDPVVNQVLVQRQRGLYGPDSVAQAQEELAGTADTGAVLAQTEVAAADLDVSGSQAETQGNAVNPDSAEGADSDQESIELARETDNDKADDGAEGEEDVSETPGSEPLAADEQQALPEEDLTRVVTENDDDQRLTQQLPAISEADAGYAANDDLYSGAATTYEAVNAELYPGFANRDDTIASLDMQPAQSSQAGWQPDPAATQNGVYLQNYYGADYSNQAQPLPAQVPPQASAVPGAYWQPGTGTPETPPNYQQPEQESGRRSWGVIILSVLVVIALIGVLVVVYWIFGRSGSDDSTSAAEQTTSSSTPTGTIEQPTESGHVDDGSSTAPSDEQTKKPIPAGAVQASMISLPSGNIGCTLSGDSVSCSILNRNWSAQGMQDCPAGNSATVKVDSTGVGLDCNNSVPIGGGQTIGYGTTVANGNVACSISESGADCWNALTGQGFTMRLAGWSKY